MLGALPSLLYRWREIGDLVFALILLVVTSCLWIHRRRFDWGSINKDPRQFSGGDGKAVRPPSSQHACKKQGVGEGVLSPSLRVSNLVGERLVDVFCAVLMFCVRNQNRWREERAENRSKLADCPPQNKLHSGKMDHLPPPCRNWARSRARVRQFGPGASFQCRPKVRNGKRSLDATQETIKDYIEVMVKRRRRMKGSGWRFSLPNLCEIDYRNMEIEAGTLLPWTRDGSSMVTAEKRQVRISVPGRDPSTGDRQQRPPVVFCRGSVGNVFPSDTNPVILGPPCILPDRLVTRDKSPKSEFNLKNLIQVGVGHSGSAWSKAFKNPFQ
ncbi:unnamed protein product [Linum trigynum]|uniref:Uncharacterized protein n=1 Tax=Linum trigynum TaxID=586398 RepID=A0AAV2D921_9ROSI